MISNSRLFLLPLLFLTVVFVVGCGSKKIAGERKIVTINGVEFVFRWCPPGTYMMGSSELEEGHFINEIQHPVTITEGFWMMETEVTQKQWEAVMGNNPSRFKGYDLPVECVYYDDCQEFCKKCNQLGMSVQLPTEEQWEYACRAGSPGAYAGYWYEMAWYNTNSDNKTHPVGTLKPNAWGLYDMHGNVWELCVNKKEEIPGIIETAPNGSMMNKWYRGGSWRGTLEDCRSARRISAEGDDLHFGLFGLRLLKTQ